MHNVLYLKYDLIIEVTAILSKYKKDRFMHGIIAITISQIIIKFLGLFYRLYLTNKEGFGDEGNAICGSGFQIYAILLTISSIGVPNAISKLVSEKLAVGDNKGAHRIFKVCFVLFSTIGFGLSLLLFLNSKKIAQNLLQIPEAELTLIALSPSIFFVTVSSVIRGYLNGREELKISARSQTIEQIFKATITIILVEIFGAFSSNNTKIMAAGANIATTLATFLGTMYLLVFYLNKRKDIWTDIHLPTYQRKQNIRKIIKGILIVSMPITLGALLGTLNKNIDAFTVVRGLKSFLTDIEAKTQYGILSGKIDTLILFPISFNVAFSIALVPKISFAITKGDLNTVKNKISLAMLFTILIGLPCSLRNVSVCRTNT